MKREEEEEKEEEEDKEKEQEKQDEEENEERGGGEREGRKVRGKKPHKLTLLLAAWTERTLLMSFRLSSPFRARVSSLCGTLDLEGKEKVDTYYRHVISQIYMYMVIA